MILTVALNPMIEKEISLDRFEYGGVNKIDNYRLRIGKSSVYSAYIMKLLQGDPFVIGFAGGIGGRYIKNFLDRNRIKSNFIWKDDELQSCFKIIDAEGTETILLDRTAKFDDRDSKNLRHRVIANMQDAECVLINGDTLGPMSQGMMQETLTLAKKAGKHTVLCAEGMNILDFLQTAPYAWIVDDEQLAVFGVKDAEVRKTLANLHEMLVNYKVRYIFYATGEGIYGISRNKIVLTAFSGIDITPVPWFKEAIAGGVAIGIKRKYEFEKIMKIAYAIYATVDQSKFPEVCTRKEIDSVAKKSKVIEIYNKGNFVKF